MTPQLHLPVGCGFSDSTINLHLLGLLLEVGLLLRLRLPTVVGEIQHSLSGFSLLLDGLPDTYDAVPINTIYI